MSETLSAPPPPAPVIADVAPVVVPAVVAPAPVAATEPVVAPVIEAPAPDAAPLPTTVLGDALKPAPVEVTPPVEVAPIVEGQSAEPAPPPAFEPFTLPEGMTFEQERIGDFTSLLGAFEGETKADHAKVQALGQQLLDRHVAEVQRTVEGLTKGLTARWETQKVEWKDQFLKDPEIGGNRWQTSVDSAINFIRTHGGTDAQQAEFQDLMESSGLGNHPAMIRILAKAGAAMSEGRPLAAQQPATVQKSKTEKLYGGAG